jgi:hypothetical protein
MGKRPKRRRDMNQPAKLIVDIAIGEAALDGRRAESRRG